MKYSKGEWKYTEALGANLSMIAGSGNVVCGLPNPIPTGDKFQDTRELMEMRANANLICTAPNMYEELIHVCCWLDRLIEQTKKQILTCGNIYQLDALKAYLKNYETTRESIYKVITKADGE